MKNQVIEDVQDGDAEIIELPLGGAIPFTPNEDIVFLTHEKERLENELKELNKALELFSNENAQLKATNEYIRSKFNKYRNAIKSIVDYAE